MMQSTLMQSVVLSDSYSVEVDNECSSDFVIVDATASLDDDFDDDSYDDCDLRLSSHEHFALESHLEAVDASDDSSLLELQSLNNGVDLTIESMLDEAHEAAKHLTVCDENVNYEIHEKEENQQHCDEKEDSSIQNCTPIQQEQTVREDPSLSKIDKSAEEKSPTVFTQPASVDPIENQESPEKDEEVPDRDDSEVKEPSVQGNILAATFSRLSNKKRRKKAKLQKKMVVAAAARASLEEKTSSGTKIPSKAPSSSRTKGLTRYNKKRVANLAVSCAKQSLIEYEKEMKQSSNKIR